MITLVEGAIGSGKTYFVVSELLRLYFRWDDVNVQFVQADDNVVIYTNVDCFRYGNELSEEIEKAGGVANFFTKDYQREKACLKKIVYVIDECQEYFDRKFYNKNVFNCFQSSRRVGIDVYLITQDIYSVAREISTLCEHHIKVSRRSFSLMGEFRYQYMSGNEVFKRKVLRSDKRVFAQYRSSLGGSASHKPSRFAFKYYMIIITLFLMIPLGGYGFIWLLTGNRPMSPKVVSGPNSAPVSSSVIVLEKPRLRFVGVSSRYRYYVDNTGSVVKRLPVKDVKND